MLRMLSVECCLKASPRFLSCLIVHAVFSYYMSFIVIFSKCEISTMTSEEIAPFTMSNVNALLLVFKWMVVCSCSIHCVDKKLFGRKSKVHGVNWNIPCREKKISSSKLLPNPDVTVCLNSSLNVWEWLASVFVLSEVIKIDKVAVSSCCLSFMR